MEIGSPVLIGDVPESKAAESENRFTAYVERVTGLNETAAATDMAGPNAASAAAPKGTGCEPLLSFKVSVAPPPPSGA